MKQWNDLLNRLFNLLKEYPRLTDDFLRQLKESGRPDGPWSVEIWSRDCDMCESTRIHTCNSFSELLESFVVFNEGWESWEGPNTWTILDYIADDSYHQRDRIMEAYENGHPWRV